MVAVLAVVQAVCAVVGALEGVVALFGSKSGVCVKAVQVMKGLVGLEPAVEAIVNDPSVATVVEQAPQVISQVQEVVKDVEQKK